MKKNSVIKFPNYKKPTNPINFFKGYNSALNKTIQEVDYKKVEKIYKILNSIIKKKGQIFVAGNGGSASASDPNSGVSDGAGYYYPTNGTVNTGGGGGGVAGTNGNAAYGHGGSGVVILRMTTSIYSGTTTGTPTVTTSGDHKVLVFNSSGSYTG